MDSGLSSAINVCTRKDVVYSGFQSAICMHAQKCCVQRIFIRYMFAHAKMLCTADFNPLSAFCLFSSLSMSFRDNFAF